MLYSKEERKVFQGLNPITEQYLFKLRKEKGINVPRGCYHAVMTTEEMVNFDYWRQVRMGRSRQRFFITSGIEPWNFGPRRPQMWQVS